MPEMTYQAMQQWLARPSLSPRHLLGPQSIHPYSMRPVSGLNQVNDLLDLLDLLDLNNPRNQVAILCAGVLDKMQPALRRAYS
jgi:hypothetical protein